MVVVEDDWLSVGDLDRSSDTDCVELMDEDDERVFSCDDEGVLDTWLLGVSESDGLPESVTEGLRVMVMMCVGVFRLEKVSLIEGL